MWTEPKTNWVYSDMFEMEMDYVRIRENILHLYDLLDGIVGTKETLNTMVSLSYDSNGTVNNIIRSSFLNNPVYNTNYIRNSLVNNGIDIRISTMNTYVGNQAGWNYNDLNILEDNHLILFTLITKRIKAKQKLPIQLGQRGF